MSVPTRNCMYCDMPTRPGKRGEHIIPEAIGGALTLVDACDKLVCVKCNNGPLSQIDKELCSRSYLSVIASQEIDAHLWQVWDIDHSSNNMLVEAEPRWQNGLLKSVFNHPQVIIERDRISVRGDLEEMEQFGFDDFSRVLIRASRRAFERWYFENEKKAIHFERVRSDLAKETHYLPPRLFARRSIQEISKRIDSQSFILRFAESADRRFALRKLNGLNNDLRFTERGHVLSSRAPSISVIFNVGDLLRALLKMGLNLVAALTTKTPINRETFHPTVQIIKGDLHPHTDYMASSGFVRVSDLDDIKSPPGNHSFRILYLGKTWHVYSSFFGGRVGTWVFFNGPCKEDWLCANVLAPIRSKVWTVTRSRILQPLNPTVEWMDAAKMCPTLHLHHYGSDIQVDPIPPLRPFD